MPARNSLVKKLGEIVGEKVKAYRNLNHWTQEKLAEKAGISTRAVTMVEKGRMPKQATLTKLALALNTSEFMLASYAGREETECDIYRELLERMTNLSEMELMTALKRFRNILKDMEPTTPPSAPEARRKRR